MSFPPAVVAAVRSFLRAVLTGDAELLAASCLPHEGLDRLVEARSTPPPPELLEELDHLQLHGGQIDDERHLVMAWSGGALQLLIVQGSTAGPRVDARYAIAALDPDDERRRVARRFYLAMLLGDLAGMRALAFDPRGLELLAGAAPPAGEVAQLAHITETMGLARVQPGERFWMPRGAKVVSAQHEALGIEVWRGLAPDGELPFLLRQRDGAWKVIPAPFVEAAVLARGGTFGESGA
ncbi:MAG: hypothetical protein H6835_03125 [Planctomycetes bacterium]|nr:hypothetical protein [Planctomycetota bacterium]